MLPKNNRLDVLIIGKGSLGLSLACHLLQQGQNVKVISPKHLLKTTTVDDHPQLIAIRQASYQWFEKLGLVDSIPFQHHCQPFNHMHIWDDKHKLNPLHFDKQHPNQPLGWILDNTFLKTLLHKTCQTINPNYLEEADLEAITQANDHICLHTRDHKKYRANLLVAADGKNSWVRNQIHIAQHIKPYHQSAITALIQTEKHHENTAKQMVKYGQILGLLPWKSGHYCGLVWSANTDMANQLMQLTDKAFQYHLENAIDAELGTISLKSPRQSFVLKRSHAKRYYQGRAVLIGDAAHHIHPLAGQGGNLGFSDAICLANYLLKASKLTNTKDYESAILAPYERRRKPENAIMIASIDAMLALFRHGSYAASRLRAWGFQMINKQSILKRLLIHAANYPLKKN